MRRRSEPHTFEQRLEAQRLLLEHELASLPAGVQRDSVAARIEQLQTRLRCLNSCCRANSRRLCIRFALSRGISAHGAFWNDHLQARLVHTIG